jgi:hypothetical protein
MCEPPVATEEEFKHLLQLAGAPASDERAMSWLRDALVAAQAFNRAAKQRPLSADHNDLLADVAKKARELAKQLQRLRRQPNSWHAFWRSVEPQTASSFTRRAVAEDDVKRAFREPVDRARVGADEVLSILKNVERAAQTARDRRKGRPRVVGKQHVVDLAFAFFVRYSPLEPSGTPTGTFARFARAFYAAAIKLDPDDDDGLDRQIRTASASPVERERATQMSTRHRNKSS